MAETLVTGDIGGRRRWVVSCGYEIGERFFLIAVGCDWRLMIGLSVPHCFSGNNGCFLTRWILIRWLGSAGSAPLCAFLYWYRLWDIFFVFFLVFSFLFRICIFVQI
jgi:hypothetical protein